MCTGIEIAALVMGGLGAASAVTQKTPEPPKIETPAIAAPTSRAPGATVRLGNSDTDITNTDTSDGTPGFAAKRKSAKSLGSLGRSGLAI